MARENLENQTLSTNAWRSPYYSGQFSHYVTIHCALVHCAETSQTSQTDVLTESVPVDGNIQPDQLKDLTFLECAVKVC